MKNRFFLIALAILALGLFVTANVRAEDGIAQAQPQHRLSRKLSNRRMVGAHQRDSWGRFNYAR